MSFTEDELQAFNTILERRFAAHRQEMEQALDQRLNDLRHEIAQQFDSAQQGANESLDQRLVDQENKFVTDFITGLSVQQDQIAQTFKQSGEEQQQKLEATVDRMLAAQLLGIEHLFSQHAQARNAEPGAALEDRRLPLETIEVQAELPWEDLVGMMRKALDERLVWLDNSVQRSVKDLEEFLTLHLHNLSVQVEQSQIQGQLALPPLEKMTSLQEALNGMEQLEQIVESVQIVMAANHALLSNRLHHHQQLPLERAHPTTLLHASASNGADGELPQIKEFLNGGSDIEHPHTDQQKAVEGPEEQ